MFNFMNPNAIARVIRLIFEDCGGDESASNAVVSIADEVVNWFSDDKNWASQFSPRDFYSDCGMIAPEDEDENAIS
jgi:hypothetical protein